MTQEKQELQEIKGRIVEAFRGAYGDTEKRKFLRYLLIGDDKGRTSVNEMISKEVCWPPVWVEQDEKGD